MQNYKAKVDNIWYLGATEQESSAVWYEVTAVGGKEKLALSWEMLYYFSNDKLKF